MKFVSDKLSHVQIGITMNSCSHLILAMPQEPLIGGTSAAPRLHPPRACT